MTKPTNIAVLAMTIFLIAGTLALTVSASSQTGTASGGTSAAPLGVKDVAAVMPLTGETLQLFANGIYYKGATPNQTLTNFGVFGTDEGYPVEVGNQIIFFFGDTLGAFRGPGGQFFRYTENRGEDSIAYMPNQTLAHCHYIQGLLAQLEAGNHNPSPDTKGCPILKFYTNAAHNGSQPAFQPITINGLTGDEGTGPSETPVGSFYLNGYLYMFYSDIIQPTEIQHSNFHLETILAKSTEPVASFSAKKPPVFQKLYVASAHPPIADVAALPIEINGPGKFIRTHAIVFSHASLAANGMLGGLPQDLQTAQQVIILFGSSWKNTSNLYLAAVDASKIESGTGAWWYLVDAKGGASGWSHDESAARPLFSTWNITQKPWVGEHGLVWSDELRKFILLYTHHRGSPVGGVVARFASLPWGPWSEEVSILGTEDALAKAIYHHEGDPITSNNAPWYNNPRKRMPIHIDDLRAGPYGPYFIGQHDVNEDGGVTYYFTFSPFVPYEVFLMKATFCATAVCK
jgi:hypothetical protein